MTVMSMVLSTASREWKRFTVSNRDFMYLLFFWGDETSKPISTLLFSRNRVWKEPTWCETDTEVQKKHKQGSVFLQEQQQNWGKVAQINGFWCNTWSVSGWRGRSNMAAKQKLWTGEMPARADKGPEKTRSVSYGASNYSTLIDLSPSSFTWKPQTSMTLCSTAIEKYDSSKRVFLQ